MDSFGLCYSDAKLKHQIDTSDCELSIEQQIPDNVTVNPTVLVQG